MSILKFTPIDEIPKIRAELQTAFDSGKLKSIRYRKYQLLQLIYLIKDNKQRFIDALKADMGRPEFEANMLDIIPSLNEAVDAFHNCEKWAASEAAPFSLKFAVMSPSLRKEPKGVVLIIVPFNVPVSLGLQPLASALAAGNAVVIKPSDQTPAISTLYAELIPKYLDPALVRVVNGSIDETTELLRHPWGHLFYTGSGRVGKIVSSAAGKTLTPLTLELGGKSPVFVDATCDLHVAAKRILWGRFINAGQVCIAPDYVLVPREFQDKFVAALLSAYNELYPDAKPSTIDYGRLITPQAFARVNNLLVNTKGTVIAGGQTDASRNFVAPTIVKDVKFGDSLLTEETFGPILTVVPIDNIDEGIAFVNAHDHPLVLYVFSKDKKFQEHVFSRTQSGAAIANDTVMHPAVDGIPFGGIGPSGSGSTTGKFGFMTFTHIRASINSPSWLDLFLGIKYPPYTNANSKKFDQVMMHTLPPRATGPHDLPVSWSEYGKIARWVIWAGAAGIILAGVINGSGKIERLGVKVDYSQLANSLRGPWQQVIMDGDRRPVTLP